MNIRANLSIDMSKPKSSENTPCLAPLRTRSALSTYSDVSEIIENLRPTEPVFCINPSRLEEMASKFESFPGRVLYAVKCNPHPFVLETLFEHGIKDFDVASQGEIELIHSLFGPAAGQFFNNPAKSRPAIRAASENHGIRFYTVDCKEEAEKVLSEAKFDDDLIIAVRLATPSRDARYVLSTKFGAQPESAVEILKFIRSCGVKAGVSFHVGSQCLAPHAFGAALALVGKVIARAGVPISVLNVGGGFPAPYPGDRPPGIEHFFSQIVHGRSDLNLDRGCMLLCEPGRALVASAGTVILQVVARRGQSLFLNDGIFGTLQELGHSKEHRPVRLVRSSKRSPRHPANFTVYGPTCDSNDVLGAPFVLPDDVREGDWLDVGMMGAYSLSMRTQFNGFYTDRIVAISEASKPTK